MVRNTDIARVEKGEADIQRLKENPHSTKFRQNSNILPKFSYLCAEIG